MELKKCLTALAALSLASLALAVTCTVDWTTTGSAVNRGLLSVHGFMQCYVEPDPNVVRTFQLTNPTGTYSRLETWIDRMEPANDNANPAVFNWTWLYPQRMLRFIDNRTLFDYKVDQLGMSRLLLLCYNVPWLNSGNAADPVSNKDEWAEFAAACVQTYNGLGFNSNPPVPIVEIWNEPNLSFFYSGTRESYFELFRKAAQRIHRDYPGVLVAGPAVSPDGDPTTYLNAFLAGPAADCDVLSYHCYGQSVSSIVSGVQSWSSAFRALPGKANGKIAITETDYATTGWTKSRYMIDRQFRLYAIQDLIHSVHQFCALAYNESGSYTFGILDNHGMPIEGTFWPLWMFRGLMGNFSTTSLAGSDAGNFACLASRHANASGAVLCTSILRNASSSTRSAVATLKFAASTKPRSLVVERLGSAFRGVSAAIPIGADQTSVQMNLTLAAYEVVSLSLREGGTRHLGYQDIFNQEGPWVTVTPSLKTIKKGDLVAVDVGITNTTPTLFQGYVNLAGLPSGWASSFVGGKSTVRLMPGESTTRTVRFTAGTAASGSTFGLFATVGTDGNTRSGVVEKSRAIPVTMTMQ